jgi:hypothetical protein
MWPHTTYVPNYNIKPSLDICGNEFAKMRNMSSTRHPETNGLTERVNLTFQQLLRCVCCYDGSNSRDMLRQVEFAYTATRALGIKHTPFEASFGFSPEEPPCLLFIIRP